MILSFFLVFLIKLIPHLSAYSLSYYDTVKTAIKEQCAYVVGVAPSGKAWCFLFFYDSQAA